MTRNAPPIYIIGDIHGQYDQLVELLRGVGLVDERVDWAGGAALLWLIGDFFDRGPCGIESVDLVMRLQIQAEQVGGCVRALLGNHEPLILSAQRFGEQRTAWGGTFLWDWRRNGGSDEELERLTPHMSPGYPICRQWRGLAITCWFTPIRPFTVATAQRSPRSTRPSRRCCTRMMRRPGIGCWSSSATAKHL